MRRRRNRGAEEAADEMRPREGRGQGEADGLSAASGDTLLSVTEAWNDRGHSCGRLGRRSERAASTSVSVPGGRAN